MNRSKLEHIIRAAGSIADDTDVIVLGSTSARWGQILICELSSAKGPCIAAWGKQERCETLESPEMRGHIPLWRRFGSRPVSGLIMRRYGWHSLFGSQRYRKVGER